MSASGALVARRMLTLSSQYYLSFPRLFVIHALRCCSQPRSHRRASSSLPQSRHSCESRNPFRLYPPQAKGFQNLRTSTAPPTAWVPAFAGMTGLGRATECRAGATTARADSTPVRHPAFHHHPFRKKPSFLRKQEPIPPLPAAGKGISEPAHFNGAADGMGSCFRRNDEFGERNGVLSARGASAYPRTMALAAAAICAPEMRTWSSSGGA
jgi:hypothetical protein